MRTLKLPGNEKRNVRGAVDNVQRVGFEAPHPTLVSSLNLLGF